MAKKTEPSAFQRRLAVRLRKLREESELRLEDVTSRLRWSATKLSRAENSLVKLKPKDTADLCDLYGVSPERTEELISLTRDMWRRHWWQRYTDVMAGEFVGLEAEAALAQVFESEVVPGLLQTADYTRALARVSLPGVGSNEIERRVEFRQRRQDALRRETDPLRMQVVLSEAVLHRTAGGDRDVVRAQFDHLAAMAELPNIELQVLTFATGPHASVESGFAVLRYPEDPAVAWTECAARGILYDDARELDRFETVFDQLRAQALDPRGSMEIIRRFARDM